MDTIALIGIALGLAMDAFAVSIACSLYLKKVSARQIFRIGFHFGLFQGIMPIMGWLAGTRAAPYIVDWDHWIAFVLLLYVGMKAIREALKGDANNANRADPTRGMMLVFYSIATSIDALAIGLSLAMINVEILYPAIIIGIVTAAVSTIGMIFGGKIGARFGNRMEIAGGFVLIFIGFKILIAHLLM